MTSMSYSTYQSLKPTIKEETNQDQSLQDLLGAVKQGWPETKQEAAPGVGLYSNFRDKINQQDGILFKGERVIIPTSLRWDMLKIVHKSHLGIEKSELRAKDVLFRGKHLGSDLCEL